MLKKYIRLLKQKNSDYMILERTSNGYFYYKGIYHINDYKNALNELKTYLDNGFIFLGINYTDNQLLYDNDYINMCTNEYIFTFANTCSMDVKTYINYLIINWEYYNRA